MSRSARLLVALLGLWGGALAWSHASQPQQEHVSHLRYTGQAASIAAMPLSAVPATPRAEDRVVRRDLFASQRPSHAASSTATAPTVIPAATPIVVAARPSPPAVHYVGFFVQGATRKVLISGTAGVEAVAEGDTIGGDWRVDRIADDKIVLRSALTGETADIARTP